MPSGKRAPLSGTYSVQAVSLVRWLLLALGVLSPAPGLSDNVLSVDGIRIEYGFVPASAAAAHPEGHEERRMHEQTPRTAHSHHLVLVLTDARSGARIEDAEVFAAVGPVGLEGPPLKLERMGTGSTRSYGGYFRIAAPGPHRALLRIQRPGQTKPVSARIDHLFQFPPGGQ